MCSLQLNLNILLSNQSKAVGNDIHKWGSFNFTVYSAFDQSSMYWEETEMGRWHTRQAIEPQLWDSPREDRKHATPLLG